MHLEILNPDQNKLLPLIDSFYPQFGLVGGTAIAAYIGHRRSIDFDLFSLNPFSYQKVRTALNQKAQINHTFIQGENELTVLVNEVKLTFYFFPYPIAFNQEFTSKMRMPSLIDLGAMKLFAMGNRAKWKDYLDIFFLLNEFSFEQLVHRAKELFGSEFNEKLCRVHLGYFDDIDYSEEVDFMPGHEVSADKVKKILLDISLR